MVTKIVVVVGIVGQFHRRQNINVKTTQGGLAPKHCANRTRKHSQLFRWQIEPNSFINVLCLPVPLIPINYLLNTDIAVCLTFNYEQQCVCVRCRWMVSSTDVKVNVSVGYTTATQVWIYAEFSRKQKKWYATEHNTICVAYVKRAVRCLIERR